VRLAGGGVVGRVERLLLGIGGRAECGARGGCVCACIRRVNGMFKGLPALPLRAASNPKGVITCSTAHRPCGTLPRTCETPTALPAVGASETRPAKAPGAVCHAGGVSPARHDLHSAGFHHARRCVCPRPRVPYRPLFSPCSSRLAPSPLPPPPVTREDQRRINAFGRLNNRKQDVQAELAGKKARRGSRRGREETLSVC